MHAYSSFLQTFFTDQREVVRAFAGSEGGNVEFVRFRSECVLWCFMAREGKNMYYS